MSAWRRSTAIILPRRERSRASSLVAFRSARLSSGPIPRALVVAEMLLECRSTDRHPVLLPYNLHRNLLHRNHRRRNVSYMENQEFQPAVFPIVVPVMARSLAWTA